MRSSRSLVNGMPPSARTLTACSAAGRGVARACVRSRSSRATTRPAMRRRAVRRTGETGADRCCGRARGQPMHPSLQGLAASAVRRTAASAARSRSNEAMPWLPCSSPRLISRRLPSGSRRLQRRGDLHARPQSLVLAGLLAACSQPSPLNEAPAAGPATPSAPGAAAPCRRRQPAPTRSRTRSRRPAPARICSRMRTGRPRCSPSSA